MSRTDILMVSHGRDFEFASYAMRSVAKYCRGFGRPVLVVPVKDLGLFVEPFTKAGWDVNGFEERPDKGMLHHQVCILQADLWCPEADYVLHLDSDCLFVEQATPDDYIIDNKPILYRERFADFQHHPNRVKWQKCVMDATGINPEWETMVRHPAVHVTGLYGHTRQIITEHTGQPYDRYVLGCQNEYPQTFAEFPTLGAVAIKHCPHLYNFVDKQDGGGDYVYTSPRDKIKQFWSHAGVDCVRPELEYIVG